MGSLIGRSSKFLQKPMKAQFPAVLVAAVALVAVGYMIQTSRASTSASMYLTPATGTVAPGATVTMGVRVNSGTTAVNAAQADLTYPAADLEFVSIDAASSAFAIEAPSKGGSGHVTIARGTTTPVTGDTLLANVTFRALNPNGRLTLSLDPSSIVADAAQSSNILTTTTGSTLKAVRSKK